MSSRIHAITQLVEKERGPFGVSRLIMMSGVPIREYGPETPDENGEAIRKVAEAAISVLGPERASDVQKLVGS